jgi:acid phosphatase (class A)
VTKLAVNRKFLQEENMSDQRGGMTGGNDQIGGMTGGTGGASPSGWFWVPGGVSRILVPAPPPGRLAHNPETLPMLLKTNFPEGGWDPLLKAALVASAFAAVPAWRNLPSMTAPDDSEAALKKELSTLIMLIDKRAGAEDRAAEIVDQAVDFTHCFAYLATASATSRPATGLLILIGLQVGGLVAGHYKMRYMRARPVQVWPNIRPVIATPPHPSYPNGHALQSYMIARCIGEVAPALRPACDAMAERIGRNREIAGVHWPSVREASLAIADDVMAILRGVDEFKQAVEDAKTEWPDNDAANPPQAAPDDSDYD